jgi:tetratricopeptide (TPR) repeat protein
VHHTLCIEIRFDTFAAFTYYQITLVTLVTLITLITLLPGHQMHLIAEVKKSSAKDLAKHFSAFSDVFPTLTKSQQQECADEFYQWADANKQKHPLHFAYAKFLTAWNDFLADRLEHALKVVVEAKQQFETLNDDCGKIICNAVMAGAYRTMGNIDLTLKLGFECYRSLIPIGLFPHFLSACSYVIGIIYFELNNDSEALHYLESTLQQAEESGDLFWKNYSLHGLGKLFLREKNYDKAKRFFERALSDAEKSGNQLAICNSLTELGNYHFQSGNYSESERLHTQALNLRLENNFIGGAVTSYLRLGEILIRDAKHDEARDVLMRGLSLAEQIKVKPKIYHAHQLLSEIFECRNDAAKALHHYRLFHEVRAEVEEEEFVRRVKNSKIVFEAEQAQKDNIIIRQQKTEIEKKNAQLQETIDALTLARVSRKARAFTFGIAIVMFVFEDTILHFALHELHSENYFASMAVKIGIIFSLKPINTAIEHYLMKEVLRKKKQRGTVGHAEVEQAVAGVQT